MTPRDRDSVVDRAFRAEWGRAVATLIRVLRDFDAAEEAVQEAFIAALERWPRDGVPDNPGAWITQVARNKAIDRVRRERSLRDKEAVLERLEALRPAIAGPAEALVAQGEIEDDRLRLIFTACHPALAPEARVALTLRTLGGLSTAEIARAFLVAETTMAQRLVRAKAKIAKAGIPCRVPDAEQMPERLPGVLATLYLIFNEGYLASSAEGLIREDLCAEAIRLTRVTLSMLPGEPELRGLLALMLLNDARRPARVDATGEAVPLEDQDRSLWDAERIAEGVALSEEAAAAGPVGPYTVQARIAAAHATAASAADTDWARIVRLYEWLSKVSPGPVVELNRAAAIAMAEGPGRGLKLIDALEGLDDYQPLHAARADLLRRLGRDAEAMAAYERALRLSANPAERRYIEARIAESSPARG
ncbi:MAG TPA: sigma-70 family RNA polymerase sigma factor [Solirubrobacterales bacterium]|nr:sigma-70 family RNA polymerase sigma factor [Solirubrobacterales bacterium]